MKICIKVKPQSRQEKIEKINDVNFVVWVKEPAQDGLANKGVVKALANYFKVSQSRIVIKKGFTSKNKIIEII